MKEINKIIPYSRFKEVIDEKNALKEKNNLLLKKLKKILKKRTI